MTRAESALLSTVTFVVRYGARRDDRLNTALPWRMAVKFTLWGFSDSRPQTTKRTCAEQRTKEGHGAPNIASLRDPQGGTTMMPRQRFKRSTDFEPIFPGLRTRLSVMISSTKPQINVASCEK